MADRRRSRRPGAAPTPPGWRRTRCSRRSGPATPTPTWCCPRVLRRHGLTGRDAAFATELAAGTLRRRGTYDAVLAACVDRPLAQVEPGVLDALRLGAHQLLSMRVPPHAAISTTVDLVHDRGRPRSGRLHQRGAAQGRPARPRRLGAPGGARPVHRPDRVRRRGPQPPALDRGAADRGGGGGRDRRPAGRRQPRPAGGPGGPARAGARSTSSPATRTRFSPYGVVMDGRRPGVGARRGRGPGGRPGRGLPAGGARPGPGGRRRPTTSGGSTCAPGPGARRPCSPVSPPEQRGPAPRRRAPARTGPGWSPARSPAPTARWARSRSTAPGRPGGRRASTGSWSTRPARASVPCAAGPRPGGGAPPPTSTTWCRSRSGCSTARSTASGPAGSCSTPPARRCWPRPPGVVQAVLDRRDDVELLDAAPLLPEVPDAAGPLAGTLQLWPHRHQTDAMFMALLGRSGQTSRLSFSICSPPGCWMDGVGFPGARPSERRTDATRRRAAGSDQRCAVRRRCRPAAADDTVVVRGLAFPTSDTYLTYFGCADLFHRDSAPPRVRIGQVDAHPDRAPQLRAADARRRHRLRPGDPGRLRGRDHRGRLLRARRLGSTGVAYVWYVTPGIEPGQVWAGRADLASDPPWQYVDAAAATYHWTLYDVASGSVVEAGRQRHHRRLHRPRTATDRATCSPGWAVTAPSS